MSNLGTDTRPPFFLIEETVVDDYNLHPLAGWLYVVIVRHINRKRNDAFPSVARLARLANMSKASVIRYTKALEVVGLISVSREKDESGENQVNHYRLLTATGVVSDSNRAISMGGVVSDSNHSGIHEQLGVVADVVHNQKNTNQMKEPEKEKEAPSVSEYGEPLINLPKEMPADPEERGRLYDETVKRVADKMNGNSEPAWTEAQLQENIRQMFEKYGKKPTP